MFRRYYSHYIYIYPNIYLKNTIVEFDAENKISDIFLFEKEIEKTEFYSGWLYLVDTQENILHLELNLDSSPSFADVESALKLVRGRSFIIIDEDKRIITNTCV